MDLINLHCYDGLVEKGYRGVIVVALVGPPDDETFFPLVFLHFINFYRFTLINRRTKKTYHGKGKTPVEALQAAIDSMPAPRRRKKKSG